MDHLLNTTTGTREGPGPLLVVRRRICQAPNWIRCRQPSQHMPLMGTRRKAGVAARPDRQRDKGDRFSPLPLRAGRSAVDRLLCKQEALGSNPSRST